MAKDDVIQMQVKILEHLPSATFMVEFEHGHKMLGHISGKHAQELHLVPTRR
jgi:translation initiation factor IF-1